MLEKIWIAQKSEITEHLLYLKLAQSIKEPENKKVLGEIAKSEWGHYQFWRKYTQKEAKPNSWKLWGFYWISKLLGITFGIKLMERGEGESQIDYAEIAKVVPEAQQIIEDEVKHEQELIALIEEEKLKYVGSVVLGLNDALVELTGTLAGLTFALQNTRLIALAGLITGIAASLSMAASEYLSQKHESETQNPLKASIYTGVTYIVTVTILILPYLLFSNYLFCLGFTLASAILIILAFNFYISVAQDLPFKRRFFEMAAISIGVAAISFVIGYLVRIFLGVDV